MALTMLGVAAVAATIVELLDDVTVVHQQSATGTNASRKATQHALKVVRAEVNERVPHERHGVEPALDR